MFAKELLPHKSAPRLTERKNYTGGDTPRLRSGRQRLVKGEEGCQCVTETDRQTEDGERREKQTESGGWVGKRVSDRVREERETETDRDRQRQRQRETETDRDRQTETDRQRQTETETDRDRQTETERDRD